MEKIILASGSPRRKALLENYGFDIEIIKPCFDENSVTEKEPAKLVTKLAEGKNRCVDIKDRIILSADTVVAIDNEILGKPLDRDDAVNMLRRLSGNTHSVYTGVCISKNGVYRSFCAKSDVTFYKLTESQIQLYADTKSPLDKAGSYGIQDDIAIGFVRSLTGELSNVIGLPMGAVIDQLKNF